MTVGRLHVISDRTLTGDDRLAPTLAQVAEAGADAIHLRERDLPAAQLYDLAVALRRALPSRVQFFINDRVDVALAVGADGVQLGERSLPVAVARRLGPKLLIGRSAHSVESAGWAAADGADFIMLGTIFASRSHPEQAPAGVDLIRAVSRVVRLPVIAVGGVTRANVAKALEAGAHGVAVISAVLGSASPVDEARLLASAVTTPRPGGLL